MHAPRVADIVDEERDKLHFINELKPQYKGSAPGGPPTHLTHDSKIQYEGSAPGRAPTQKWLAEFNEDRHCAGEEPSPLFVHAGTFDPPAHVLAEYGNNECANPCNKNQNESGDYHRKLTFRSCG